MDPQSLPEVTPGFDGLHDARRRRRRGARLSKAPDRTTLTSLLLISTSIILPFAHAQSSSCISLSESSACTGFNASSISTGSQLTGLFPFLSFVSDVRSFDKQLQQYIQQGYVRSKYQDLFGCSGVDLTNTTSLYARYTQSFLCNSIVQNSVRPCQLSSNDARPLCSDACSDFASSEQEIVSSPSLCGSPKQNAIQQLRADFTNCNIPEDSITKSCIPGYQNEPDNCGYQDNLQGLCSFCRSSTVNATDSCCVTSQSETRCEGVKLPVYRSMPPLFTTTSGPSSRPTSAKNAPSDGEGPSQGLSAGQIAGIVVGSVVGAAILLALLVFACLLFRRKKQRDEKTSLNQPTPPRSGIPNKKSRGFEALPGTRITGITALAGSSASSPHNALHSASNGAGTSSGIDTSPESQRAYGALGMAPLPKRDKSLSDGVEDSSPGSAGYSSGDGAVPAQSEQLDSFKDYYSTDEIHTHDLVSTLWAYQPRANDEFELERGDMLRIVGIWDDGWATGIRINQRAEDWEPERSAQRDSGVSNGSRPGDSPPTNGDVKAFPLVCVCLPHHWRKTIEGDTTDFSSSE